MVSYFVTLRYYSLKNFRVLANISPMQKKVAFALNFSNSSKTNSVGPEMGPSSNVKNNSFSLVFTLQVRVGKRKGSMEGVRNKMI